MTRLFIAVEQTPYFFPQLLTVTLLTQKANASENFECLANFLYRIKYLSERDHSTQFWIFEIEVDKTYCEIDERKYLNRTHQNRNFLFKLKHSDGIVSVISQKCFSYEDLKKLMPPNVEVGGLLHEFPSQPASNDNQYGLANVAGVDPESGATKSQTPLAHLPVVFSEIETTPLLTRHQASELQLTRYRTWVRAYHRYTLMSLILHKLLRLNKSNYKINDYESFNPRDFHQRKTYLLQHFVNAVEFSSRIGFPIIQAGLLAHDFYIYQTQSQARYGQTMTSLLLGSAKQEFVWSNNLGSTLISDPHYWIWLGSVWGFPIAIGTLNVLLHFSLFKKLAQQLKLCAVRELKNCLDIYVAHDLLAWCDYLTPQVRSELIMQLCDRAVDGNFLALRQLANIVDASSQYPSALTNITAATNSSRFFHRLYAHYLLWTLGRNDKLRFDFLFWPITLFKDFVTTYALLHFMEVFAIKLFNVAQFFYQKLLCESADNVWGYLPEWGDYFCSVCGDWNFIYQGDVFNAQSCWNGLLALPRNTTQIAAAVERFAGQDFVQVLDFSQQNWNQWLPTEWSFLLNRIQASMLTVGIFNLSSLILNPYFTNPNNVRELNSFLSHMPVSHLDLSNQGLGDTLVMEVLTALENSSITNLDLSGNNISDQGLVFIAGHIPASLSTLNVSNNWVTDCGLEKFFANLTVNCGLSTLNFGYNRLNLAAPQVFARAIQVFPITHLDISGNDFSQAEFSPFWQNCTGSAVKLNSLTIANANLGDMQLASVNQYLVDMSVAEFDLSDNDLSDQSIASFIEIGSQNSTITSIDFSGNLLGDYSIQAFANYVDQSNLNYLGVARGIYTMLNMPQFMQTIARSQVREISLAGNLLGDSLIQVVAENIVQAGCRLRNLDVSANAITTNGMQILRAALSSSPIEILNLNNNQIGCMQIEVGSLEVLNLAGNPIDDACLDEIADALPHSNLRQISLAQTSISDNGTINFAKALVSPLEQANDISLPKINFDLRHALFHLRPTTNITQFDFGENLLSMASARVVCRILHGAHIPRSNAILSPSLLGGSNNLADCQTSDGGSLNPPIILRVPRDVLVGASRKIYRMKEDFLTRKNRQAFYYQPHSSLAANNSSYLIANRENTAQYWLASMLTGVLPIVIIIIAVILICRYVVPKISSMRNSFWFNYPKKLSENMVPANDAKFYEQQAIPQNKK